VTARTRTPRLGAAAARWAAQLGARCAALLGAALLVGPGCAPKSKHPEHAVLPTWAGSEIRRLDLERNYEIIEPVEPVFQMGDFDGDAKPDMACVVRNRSSGKTGVLILHRAGGGAHVLGAGRPFGNGGDDWTWMGAWRVIATTELPRGLSKGKDALVVEKPESAGGALYWTGSEYAWMQWGD
jgi:hypothetical protein